MTTGTLDRIVISSWRRRPRPDWSRWSFTAALALYGGVVGGFAVVANLLGRTPGFLDPTRVGGVDGFFVYAAGAATGVVLAAPIGYWAHGGRELLTTGRRSLGLPQWLLFGASYAVFFPLLVGGFFLPFALLLFSLYTGVIKPAGLFYATADTIMLSPLRGLATGAPFLFSAMWAGLLFVIGAALIDRLSAAKGPGSITVVWTASLALAGVVVAAAAFTPAALLARLG